MIELLRKNGLLYAQVLMDLRLPIIHKNEVFEKGKQEKLILPEGVMCILAHNGNIQFWNGKDYIKLNLGQFNRIIKKKDYTVKEYVEPKKEEPKVESKVELKKEEPKVEPKVEPKKEEPKVEPKEEVVKEQPKEQKQNDNKKQRHNNNNKQGGGK